MSIELPKLKPYPVPVLPTVYDDALSYYEQLNKESLYINEIIDDLDVKQTEIDGQDVRIKRIEDTIDELTIDSFVYRGNLTGDFPDATELSSGVYTVHITPSATGWPASVTHDGLFLVQKTTAGSRSIATLVSDQGRTYYNEFLYTNNRWQGWTEDSRFGTLFEDVGSIQNELQNTIEPTIEMAYTLLSVDQFSEIGESLDGKHIYSINLSDSSTEPGVYFPGSGWSTGIGVAVDDQDGGFLLTIITDHGDLYTKTIGSGSSGPWKSHTAKSEFQNASTVQDVSAIPVNGRCGWTEIGDLVELDAMIGFTMPAQATTVATGFPAPSDNLYFFFNVAGAVVGQARLTDAGNLQVTWARNLADGSNAAGTEFSWARFHLVYTV